MTSDWVSAVEMAKARKVGQNDFAMRSAGQDSNGMIATPAGKLYVAVGNIGTCSAC